MSRFKILVRDKVSRARVGLLETKSGSVVTPLFMPVATNACVKTLTNEVLKNLGVTTLMCNTYHLLIRPGLEVIKKAGGLHNFLNWNSLLFTDSGGFQIFSLSNFVKVKQDSIEYADHITGNKFNLSAQEVVTIQESILKSDLFVHLDYPSCYPATIEEAKEHLAITQKWALLGLQVYKGEGVLFGINQGSIYPELRLRSLEFIHSKNFEGVAIGGLGLGEPPQKTIEIIKLVTSNIPHDKPVYAMGLGRPEDIVEMVEQGVDLFDCVLPTRNGRFGRAYTYNGVLILRNNKYTDDFSPIDKNCSCFACKNYTRAFLRHLLICEEILGITMVSLHNVHFYVDMFENMRRAILEGKFPEWKNNFLNNYCKASL